MTRTLLAGVGLAAALGAQSAMATVTVLGTITKTVDIDVTETITVTKTVDLTVNVVSNATKFAEADALTNQETTQNLGCFNCAEKRDLIDGTGNTNSGVFSLNQSSGNFNNQGNTVAISVDVRVTPPGGTEPQPTSNIGFAEAQAGAEQNNSPSTNRSTNLFFRSGSINASLNGGAGVVHANQAPGNLNNQVNNVAMAVSFAIGGVALSEADLGQFNIGNRVFESDSPAEIDNPDTDQVEGVGIGINRAASIVGSINTTTGIVGVNQAVGNLSNQANIVAFAAVILP